MKNREIIRILHNVIQALNYVDEIGKLPNCNTCLKYKTCEHAPKEGEWTRINCYDYASSKHYTDIIKPDLEAYLKKEYKEE